jgi:hypothetical protein
MKIAIIALLLTVSGAATAQIDCGGCGGIPPKVTHPLPAPAPVAKPHIQRF